MSDKSEIIYDPVTEKLEMHVIQDSTVSHNQDDITISGSYKTRSYQDKFQDKQQGIHDMVKDGDGVTREEIHDLVRAAQYAVWEKSADE